MNGIVRVVSFVKFEELNELSNSHANAGGWAWRPFKFCPTGQKPFGLLLFDYGHLLD